MGAKGAKFFGDSPIGFLPTLKELWNCVKLRLQKLGFCALVFWGLVSKFVPRGFEAWRTWGFEAQHHGVKTVYLCICVFVFVYLVIQASSQTNWNFLLPVRFLQLFCWGTLNGLKSVESIFPLSRSYFIFLRQTAVPCIYAEFAHFIMSCFFLIVIDWIVSFFWKYVSII